MAPFSREQQQTLIRYAKGGLRYFTSPHSNNLRSGLTHTFYGTGKRREPGKDQELDMSRERGSHVNMEEVTLRFVALALGYQEGWLDYLPKTARYAGSWGQIQKGLASLRVIQTSTQPDHYTGGCFHRWYWTTSNNEDLTPEYIRADTDNNQASDDNALAYMNLLVLEGIVQAQQPALPDVAAILERSKEVRQAITLRRFYYPGAWIDGGNGTPLQADVIVHQILNGKPTLKYSGPSETTGEDQGIWDRAGAEGAVIAAALQVSGAITPAEFERVCRQSLLRTAVEWKSFGRTLPISQSTYDSAMFMTGVRSLHGMPVTEEERAGALFFKTTALPIFRSHLDFAEHYGFSALGSHAMSQSLGGLRPYYHLPFPGATKPNLSQFPGNEQNRLPDPALEYGDGVMARSTTPHAFFIPLSRPRYLDAAEKSWIFESLAQYEREFFHDGGEYDLGWEAVIPWKPDDTSPKASWVDSTGRRNFSDEGRPYEALNSAYIVLHVYDALHPDKPLSSFSVERERLGGIAAWLDGAWSGPIK